MGDNDRGVTAASNQQVGGFTRQHSAYALGEGPTSGGTRTLNNV